MNGENRIEISGLNFKIENKSILKNIDLVIKAGEFVGLIGPNGAGKTTLLKCMNGINKAEGTIQIKSEPIRGMKDRKLATEVAFMHQNTDVGFPLPAIDVVMMGRYPYLKRLQRESREDYLKAENYMEYTDTLKLRNSPITQMSGGERQRVLFAKTLTQEAEVILLDEPTASLDITYQEQIIKYASELSSAGRTIVAAIHDLKMAARYCSRLILMDQGEIVADGSPEEVLTSENISRVYGINTLVYRNRITGHLDLYINKNCCENRSERIHVIGGGGSASAVLRQLYENGFYGSAGVFSHGDSDIGSAEVFGMEYLVEKPFSEISDDLYNDNVLFIQNAQMTILCNMPFGTLNLRNLEAAKAAKKLVIIEDEPPESRDFTNGKAVQIYNELKKNAAAVINSAQLHEIL